jgi:hypothetical protein
MTSHGSNFCEHGGHRGRLPSSRTMTVTERMHSRRAFVQIADSDRRAGVPSAQAAVPQIIQFCARLSAAALPVLHFLGTPGQPLRVLRGQTLRGPTCAVVERPGDPNGR